MYSKLSEFIIVLICTSVVFYIIDLEYTGQSYNKCKNINKVRSILLLHHIINTFALFGWISNNKYILFIYVIFPIFILIHWKLYNNKCYLTDIINKDCELDENTYFKDLLYITGIKNLKNYDTIHKTFLFILWIVSIIKLFNIIMK